jgi:hypothetical protein
MSSTVFFGTLLLIACVAAESGSGMVNLDFDKVSRCINSNSNQLVHLKERSLIIFNNICMYI